MKINLGLRSEILISLTLLVVSGLLFSALFLLKVAENELVQERVHITFDLLQNLPRIATVDDTGTRFLNEIDWLVRQLNLQADLQTYAIFDADLQWFSGSNQAPAGSEPLDRAARFGTPRVVLHSAPGWRALVPGSGGSFECYVPLIAEGSIEGVLHARYGLDAVARRMVLAQQAVGALILGFGAVLIAFGTYLLGRTLVSPVRRLMQATTSIAAGDLSVQVPVDGPREIAQLAKSFNVMTQALEQSRGETQATIASLHRTNSELAQTRDSLVRSEKMAAVGTLAAGMAHEIGNPLSASMGYLELLQAQGRDPDQGDLLARAARELARIDRLVRDLLDFAAPQAAASEICDPATAVGEAVDLLRAQGVFEGLELRVELPRALPRVRACRHKLVQVLVNLLVNARDACAPGQGVVTLEGQAHDGEICLVVRDNGCGLSEERMKRIFDPFFTTKEPGKGRGLGLFFCHKVVEDWQGRLEVESRPGQGSAFFLTLPIAAAEGGRV
ncbi:sensor histidine kinase [Geoalkalibacter halelectricus]|uniref:histidine kinase n=1 Tax=Geoalkalibacter halelectricus TaxID=2847045 RepID=A0ABY5ZLR3_9BACT|nr:ATP-binding protein [Geoalkalibacter halelectricus]MDO3376804.1 ATP-binding protein [Geoalkalibacter halelectricus]UWZ79553.1 ATP-binding protein [Geoalkalibacter halelectricus]